MIFKWYYKKKTPKQKSGLASGEYLKRANISRG